jgi:hypothetical protein
MDQNEQGATLNTYEFTVAGAADELTGRLIQGDLDIAALPTNAISALYNKTEGKIVTLGVNTLGVLYILENGESILSIKDLEGKTILASGKGSTAEAVLNRNTFCICFSSIIFATSLNTSSDTISEGYTSETAHAKDNTQHEHKRAHE